MSVSLVALLIFSLLVAAVVGDIIPLLRLDQVGELVVFIIEPEFQRQLLLTP